MLECNPIMDWITDTSSALELKGGHAPPPLGERERERQEEGERERKRETRGGRERDGELLFLCVFFLRPFIVQLADTILLITFYDIKARKQSLCLSRHVSLHPVGHCFYIIKCTEHLVFTIYDG